MIRTLAAAASAVALIVSGVAIADAAPTPKPTPVWMTRPCAQEDGLNCYWDARSAGNGVGHSFYSVKVGRKMCTIYWGNRYARTHNNCTRLD